MSNVWAVWGDLYSPITVYIFEVIFCLPFLFEGLLLADCMFVDGVVLNLNAFQRFNFIWRAMWVFKIKKLNFFSCD